MNESVQLHCQRTAEVCSTGCPPYTEVDRQIASAFGHTARDKGMLKPSSMRWLIVASVAFVLPLSVALAQDDALPSGFEAQPLIKTGETRDNDPIVYPTGTPEIVSVIGTIAPGGRTPLHEHPVPVYVYILEGEVELRTEGGDPYRYMAGEAYIEALNRKHQLFNVGDAPAKVLVVFIGEEGKPTTVTAQ